jgi:hypothetical protein
MVLYWPVGARYRISVNSASPSIWLSFSNTARRGGRAGHQDGKTFGADQRGPWAAVIKADPASPPPMPRGHRCLR